MCKIKVTPDQLVATMIQDIERDKDTAQLEKPQLYNLYNKCLRLSLVTVFEVTVAIIISERLTSLDLKFDEYKANVRNVAEEKMLFVTIEK